MSTASATDLQDYRAHELAERAVSIADGVRRRGDDAIRELLGPSTLATACSALRLAPSEVDRCVGAIASEIRADLRLVQERARQDAHAQRAAISDFERETGPGSRLGVRHVPIASAAFCVAADGGDQHGFGVALGMAQAGVIAARVAGVSRIVACVPASDVEQPELLVAALAEAGADEIYGFGDVHGLAALRFGTESIPRAEHVCAVGDEQLEQAERLMPPAHGEAAVRGLLILADDSADPELVAADLIAAGECGPGARGVLVATSPALAARAASGVEAQLGTLRDGGQARSAWVRRGAIHVVDTREAACALADRHGFERVEVIALEPRWYLERLERCAELLLGPYAGLSLAAVRRPGPRPSCRQGDGMHVGMFLRAISYRESERCSVAETAAFARHRRLAGLEAHARACELRADRGARREPRPTRIATLG